MPYAVVKLTGEQLQAAIYHSDRPIILSSEQVEGMRLMDPEDLRKLGMWDALREEQE